jgi:hypothetical protein
MLAISRYVNVSFANINNISDTSKFLTTNFTKMKNIEQDSNGYHKQHGHVEKENSELKARCFWFYFTTFFPSMM